MMKKRVVSMILVTAMVMSSLAGCGGGKSNGDSAKADGGKGEPILTTDGVGYDDATIEISWLVQEGFDTTNQPVADYQKEKAIEFVKKHPEVRIKITSAGSQYNDAMAKLLTQASTGTAPDVAVIDSFYLPQYYEYLQPIGDVLEENNISLDSWFPFAQEIMKPEDEVLAMWYDTDVRSLYYRKDLVETPPTSWDELFATMESLKEDGYSFLYPAGKNETTSCDILPWFWAQDGELLDESGKPVFNEGANKDAMMETLNFLKKTIDAGITPQRVTSYMTDGDMIEDIAAGNVAMFVGGSWLATQIGAVLGQDTFNEMYGITDDLYIKVYNGDEDRNRLETDVEVQMDGRRYKVNAGTKVLLKPGQSITITPYMYHEFQVPNEGGAVLIGEVSMCNDDDNDNCFYEPIGRFPEIEEDEKPYRLLCNEYEKAANL